MTGRARRGPVWARLQRRLFLWFGAAILVTGLAVTGLNVLLVGGPGGFRREVEHVRRFVATGFARVWDLPAERDELAAALAAEIDAGVALRDASGEPLGTWGPPCPRPGVEVPVRREGRTLGTVAVCLERPRAWAGRRLVLALGVLGLVLWAISGRVARALAQPFVELTRVARDIGAGQLSSRVGLARGTPDEAGELAEAVNDMAGRIERQIADQRELLAAVSHEIRTPLGHVRLLAELLRDAGAKPELLDQLDREVLEIDALVGDLLASARLDFAALAVAPASGAELARTALERAGLDPSLLSVAGDPSLRGDPTLLARALANLLDNAARHAGGARALRVRGSDATVSFEAEDAGPGFAPGEETRVFQPFYAPPGERARDGRSLGLGLSLVQRIAGAHRGRAWAENLPGGGARVGFEVSKG